MAVRPIDGNEFMKKLTLDTSKGFYGEFMDGSDKAYTSIPNPDGKPCVNHLDGNKQNNRVENLEWCTHSENTLHAYEHGFENKVTGEDHHAHKLDWNKVKYR